MQKKERDRLVNHFVRWWHEHSASAVLGTLLAAQTSYSLIAGWFYFPYLFPEPPVPPFLLWWSWEYNESVLADVAGALFLIWITKKGREIGSPETGDERARRKDAT
jgi:hypothetical protein